jgi:prepilin-type N-terminal cleavage/methylation domain-containing protein
LHVIFFRKKGFEDHFSLGGNKVRPINFASRTKATGFTLVELLIVIAIIGILVGLLFPAIQAIRESSRRTKCVNNVRQIAVATHTYASNHQHFPKGGVLLDKFGNEIRMALHVYLLPLLEQNGIYDQFDLTQKYDWPNNLALTLNRVPVFLCPTGGIEKSYGSPFDAESVGGENVYTTHYYGVTGPIGVNPTTSAPYDTLGGSLQHGPMAWQGLFFPGRITRRSDIKDGATNSLAFGEFSWSDRGGQIPQYRAWSRGPGIGNEEPQWNFCARAVEHPINSDVMEFSNSYAFGSDHWQGAVFAAADGSTHFIAEDIDPTVLLSVASINGQEGVDGFE